LYFIISIKLIGHTEAQMVIPFAVSKGTFAVACSQCVEQQHRNNNTVTTTTTTTTTTTATTRRRRLANPVGLCLPGSVASDKGKRGLGFVLARVCCK